MDVTRYVKEQKRALSSLAHSCVSIDKYRPEACCVIGNYYSLKGAHEKAVTYFRRALKLDHQFLSAWTLMGLAPACSERLPLPKQQYHPV